MYNPILCPICHSKEYKDLYLLNSICRNCGHIFQKQIYNRNYYHNLPCHFPPDYDEHSIRRGKYIVDFIPSDEIPTGTKFLDVGCGKGGVIKSIENIISGSIGYGCTIETSNTNILKGDIETIELPWENFDLIILCHVLEHFLNPVETLKKISNYLTPNGIIYVEVPSFNWAEMRIPSIWTPEHLSYFTPSTLENVINLSGLTTTKLKESRYWGNIKIVCKKSCENISLKKVDYKKVLYYNSLIKLLYPWYKTMRKIKTINPND